MSRVETIDNVYIGTVKSRVELGISSLNVPHMRMHISALILPQLRGYTLPKLSLNPQWEHLYGLEFADPSSHDNTDIQMIIGSDYYGSLLLEGIRQGPRGSPTAQSTVFGWIVSGPSNQTNKKLNSMMVHRHYIDISDLQKEICRFWELEELPKKKYLTDDEQKCEELFSKTYSRNSDGRYVVRLPLKENASSCLGNSVNVATSMLERMERRLDRDPELKREFYLFIKEYEELNHMRPISESTLLDATIHSVYLPYHPVIKESSSTTRVRLVFNASIQTASGFSLNDQLLIGPKLHNDITSIILRWRTYKYAMTADICKMFRQILVDDKDVNYQRILCRTEPKGTLKHYQLLTVTYGMSCSPYLANKVLQQLAVDESTKFPEASLILKRDTYVDDILFGANTIEETLSIKKDLIELLNKGCFPLRKFSANSPELLESNIENEDQVCLVERENADRAVLGLRWQPERDEFVLLVNIEKIATWTKRIVLSVISRLYDPLGWIAPIVIVAKVFMQELWLKKIDWDEELSSDLLTRWLNYHNSLTNVTSIIIPRWTGQREGNVYEIHGFADASTKAYAAVVYLRILNDNDEPIISLLSSKTKVAPLKQVTVPRLELCAVVLLTKLIDTVKNDLNANDVTIYGWTDSTVVLSWLSKHPSNWRTFVANRVSEVHTIGPEIRWRYIFTKDNPADCASRGLFPSELLEHHLWWNGPTWLKEADSAWPSNITSDSTEEMRRESTRLHTTICDKNQVGIENLIKTVSSWPKLLRVTAYCLKFIALCRKRDQGSKEKYLVASNIEQAKKLWCKQMQNQFFHNEIKRLSENRNNLVATDRSSPLKSLCPFLDKDGILRVTGRLSNAPISWDAKHPIILPQNKVSELIIQQTHLRALHGGPQLTLYLLRQNYWVIGARSLVRKVIHKCLVCARQRAEKITQLMGELPQPRVTPCRSFEHTGIDYAGPMFVRMGKGRGYQSQKAYIALFVCMVTKALHLELVSDYTSEAFLAALKRFVSRRGLPSNLYSDNGTNFQGADKNLKRTLRTLLQNENLQFYIAHDNIKWNFIPPNAPHFGGLWEAGVKSIKSHLRRIVGTLTLTFEELNTLLCQVEACVNSRPLGSLSNDPNDLNYITPGHFLVGGPLIAVPEKTDLDLKLNQLSRWQKVQHLAEQFWKRWSCEYQHTLQQRYKWCQRKDDLKLGDLVLIRDNLLPKSKWKLGRVIKCHMGQDNLVRVVTLKTQTGECKRPISQLCKMPLLED